jgi:ABC-type lipoprotein release transport system permease subunit
MRTIEIRVNGTAATSPIKASCFLKIVLAVSRRRIISIIRIIRAIIIAVIVAIMIVSVIHFFEVGP